MIVNCFKTQILKHIYTHKCISKWNVRKILHQNGIQSFLQLKQEHLVADLKVTFLAPPTQLSMTFTSSVSMMLQHWPTDVTGFGILKPFTNGADGTA